MSFLSWLIGDDTINRKTEELRNGEHINESWIINGNKVYHVENAKNGKEWTHNRHAAPHCGHAGSENPLTEMIPPLDFQISTARECNNNSTDISASWNNEAGHYEGNTYVYSSAELSELMDKN